MRKNSKLPAATLALLTVTALILLPLCGPLCASMPCASGRQADTAECHGGVAVGASDSQQAIGAVKSCALSQLPDAKLSENSSESGHNIVRAATVFSHPPLSMTDLSESAFSDGSSETSSRTKVKNYLTATILRI
jgi:hypothetical protein